MTNTATTTPSSNSLSSSSSSSSSGLFVTKDGGLTVASFWLLLAGPLLYSGKWFYACLCAAFAFAAAVCHAIEDMQEEDKATIRFNVLQPQDIVQELLKQCNDSNSNDDNNACDHGDDDDATTTTIALTALHALAKKKTTQQSKNKKKKQQRHQQRYESNDHVLDLSCQQAAYIALESPKQAKNDAVVCAAISLLALVAKKKNNNDNKKKNETTPQQQISPSDLKLPLQIMQNSLERIIDQSIRHYESNDDDDDSNPIPESVEQLAAEVQRKYCLWLGALADQEDPELSSRIVEMGGMERILAAIDWFRLHEDVQNWAWWAIFMLCYNHIPNQIVFVTTKISASSTSALELLCQSMVTHASQSIEICRHGLAIFFDLLRRSGSQDALISTARILEFRKLSIRAGLHAAVKAAMDAHYDSMEIMGMGTDLLVSTGYEGDIPIYQPME